VRTIPKGAFVFTGVLVALCACNGSLTSSPSSVQAFVPQSSLGLAALTRSGLSSKIKHVVIIVQENRSFNNLFYGFPGAKTVTYGYTTSGKKVKLLPISLDTNWDLDHTAQGFFAACNGTGSIPGTNCAMNGFNKEYTVDCGGSGEPPCPIKHPQYAYVPHSETKPYFAMAQQYVLADQMYASNLDGSSFVAHQYLIGAQAAASVNYPLAAWGCEGGSGDKVPIIGPDRQVPYGSEVPCFDLKTIGQEADKAGVSWAYYAGAVGSYGSGGIWSAYQANEHVYKGRDWKRDIISPQTRFFNDVKKGRLRQINWITPTCANSDHAGCNSKTGPAWVASLVNAIGLSPYWDSTAIFITWDDYGGWYDPEPPAYADYDGLGVRVPMLIISPYARKGRVSHVPYELGSILKFTEDVFGLPRLSASDTRAASPEKDCFDFNKPPRKFHAIASSLDEEYFMREPPDLRPPDND
jgi:phospholipase C